MDQLCKKLSDLFSLPHSYAITGANDFRHYLNIKLREYQKEYAECCDRNSASISKYTAETFKNTLERLTNLLVDSINQYYNGFPDNSYVSYKAFLDEIRIRPSLLPVQHIVPGQSFYRVRHSNLPLTTRNELFHIPINLRTKVNNNRFSIAGFPTLYLSNSLYVAWEELQRPDLSNLYCSAFKAERVFSLLDLRKENFFDELFSCQAKRNIQAFLIKAITFPLYLICSVKVLTSHDPFKPEYIFPQHTLRWARDVPDIQGVTYTSTRVHQKSEGKFCNLALPICYTCTESSCDPLFCSDLAGLFSVSEPQLITDIASFAGISPSSLTPPEVTAFFSYELADCVDYTNSVFYKMSQCLTGYSKIIT